MTLPCRIWLSAVPWLALPVAAELFLRFFGVRDEALRINSIIIQ